MSGLKFVALNADQPIVESRHNRRPANQTLRNMVAQAGF